MPKIGAGGVRATTRTGYNLTLTLADTEYSQALPDNCLGYEYQCRSENDVRHSTTAGLVATPTAPYETLKAGDYFYSVPLRQGGDPDTLYFASDTAAVVVEIIAWT